MENRLDVLIYLLNEIGTDRVHRKTENDVVFSYDNEDLNGFNTLSICFKRKTDRNKTKIIMLRSDKDIDKMTNEAASILMRYVIYAKDYDGGLDTAGVPVSVYSAKTIFADGK